MIEATLQSRMDEANDFIFSVCDNRHDAVTLWRRYLVRIDEGIDEQRSYDIMLEELVNTREEDNELGR